MLVGVLPVSVARELAAGPRAARLSGMRADHLRSGDALALPGREHEVIPALVRALFAHEPRAATIRLREARANSPSLAIAADAHALGLRAVRRPVSRGSYIDTSGDAADQRRALSRNFVGNLRKARNKIARERDVETLFLTGDEAGQDGLRRFLALEAAGWKGAAGTAIATSREQVEFYARHGGQLRAPRPTRMARTEGGGHHDRESSLAVRTDASMVLLKIAYDERFAALSPGSVLFERSLERAFADEGVRELNCLSAQAWHRNWRMLESAYDDVWWLRPGRRSARLAVDLAVDLPVAVKARATQLPDPVQERLKGVRARVRGRG